MILTKTGTTWKHIFFVKQHSLCLYFVLDIKSRMNIFILKKKSARYFNFTISMYQTIMVWSAYL